METFGNAIGWVLGVGFVLGGAVTIISGFAHGIGFVVIGLIMLPGTWSLIERKWGFQPPRGLRGGIVLTVFAVTAYFMP